MTKLDEAYQQYKKALESANQLQDAISLSQFYKLFVKKNMSVAQILSACHNFDPWPGF